MRALNVRGYKGGKLASSWVRSRSCEEGMAVAIYDPTVKAIVASGRIARVHQSCGGSWGERLVRLGDVAATTERCPWCWRPDDNRFLPAGVVDTHYEQISNEGGIDWQVLCPVCSGAGRCDPVPVRGRQGLWEWTPELAPAPVATGGSTDQ